MNPEAESFFQKTTKWQKEYEKLRTIVLDCGLTEEFKWMHPCYTFEKNNVVLIHGFKTYCAFLFHKGVLLEDPEGLLIQQTENVQAARQIRFTNIQEIIAMKSTLEAYIYQAIEVEKAGLKVKLKETAEFTMPEEFQRALDENDALRAAFEALTPGRQRGYLLHFSKAKQSKTRESRVNKCIPQILDGMGLNDGPKNN